MNRWERKFREKAENEFLTEGNGMEAPPENSQDSDSGTETGFDLPELAGKSPQEIQEAFKVYKAAVGEQGKRLNELEIERANRPNVQPQPKVEEEEELTPEKFWENPSKNISRVVAKEIGKQLKEIVAPLEQDFATQRVKRVWDELEEVHPNYRAYKPLMDQILKSNNISNPNLNTLVSVFEMAVGKAALSGNAPSNGNEERTPVPTNRRQAPPQHSPSSQPLPNAAPKKPVRRKPTESERKVAQMQGLTVEQYLDELDRSGSDLTPPAAKA